MRSWLSIVLVGLSGLAIAACGGSGSGNPFSGGAGGNGGAGGVVLDCSTLSNPPADCDKSCTSDSQCAASFCDNGKCTANCTADEGCGAGSTCNVRGRCVLGTGGTGGTGNTGGSGCQSVTITPTRSIPNVMFLVDQSGSMVENFSGGQDRWEAAHSAITGIVSDLESIVRFGLTTYTSQNGNQNPPCPRLPTQVDFALDNAGTIGNQSVYPSSYPSQDGDDTPTGDSIDALVSVIQTTPPPAEGPTIIVLATDGEPDSCEYPDPTNDSQRTFSRNEAVSAAGNAHAAGMDLFVLWVGALTDPAIQGHIQDVANAGVGQSGAPYWVGDDPSSLQGAFQQIISDSISCDVQMDKQFDDVDKACDEGNVRLNGMPLDCPSQWRVKPGVDNVIELVGSACQTFKSGDVTFSAVFPCGAIVVE
ncbi:MAG: vWA domain-containing protein [Polyangiales bacterium]